MSEFLSVKITEIVIEAVDAITIVFEGCDGKAIEYLPGQFLTLVLNINGRELRRSYSLCTAPGIDSLPAITVKRVVNGEVSRYLIDNLKKGDILKVLAPAGRFTLETGIDYRRDIFLIGAGSGIIPLFSHLKNILEREQSSYVVLINCNKNEQHILYRSNLEELQERHRERLDIVHLLSDPGEAFKSLQGRLNIELLEKLVRTKLRFDRSESQFMVCGPYSFMRMVSMTLTYMGFEENQIRKENFVIKTENVQSPPLNLSTRNVKLVIKNKEHLLQINAGKTILDEALANGISLPYSCRAGVCSTCIGVCKSGKVHMINNQVLTEKEIRNGLILTCVSFPVSEDVVIEF